jgi:DnaK suppressor protein
MKLRKTQLEQFKKWLLAERSRILKQSLKLGSAAGVEQEDLSDEMDHASSEVNQAMTFRLKDRERFLLSKIDKALSRIEKGDYGMCIDCGNHIEVKRLQARPVTDLCINCKEDRERVERSYA